MTDALMAATVVVPGSVAALADRVLTDASTAEVIVTAMPTIGRVRSAR